ncbi:hypothetical protein D3C71_2107890 [compost metagenome]
MLIFILGDREQLDNNNYSKREQQQKFCASSDHLHTCIHHPDTEQADNQHRSQHGSGGQDHCLAEFPEIAQNQ